MLATVRPDDINVALLVHVLGAMVLVGGTLATVGAALIGWRDETLDLLRFSYKSLLAVALPGFVVMRLGAAWVYEKENLGDLPEDPAWLGIGFVVADPGALLFIIALILGGIGLRQSRSGGGRGLLKASAVLSTILLVAYVVAVWAMGGKPS